MKWVIKHIILFSLLILNCYSESWGYTNNFNDSTYILRNPSDEFIDSYRNNPDFDYTVEVYKGFGFWDWLKYKILQKIFRVRVTPELSNILDYILYIIIAGILIAALVIFYKKKGHITFASKSKKLFIDEFEDISSQDKDKYQELLDEAESKNDYVLSTRILYSRLLFILNEKGIIKWQASKPNKSYMYEIENQSLCERFESLTYIFNHVTYGEFFIEKDFYSRIKSLFSLFDKEVGA